MKNQINKLLQTKDIQCPDACLVDAIMKIVAKNLSSLISSDAGNTLVLGTDNKLKAS